jgi:hypothetical protein
MQGGNGICTLRLQSSIFVLMYTPAMLATRCLGYVWRYPANWSGASHLLAICSDVTFHLCACEAGWDVWGFVCLQLLLEESGLIGELKHIEDKGGKEKSKQASGRLRSLNVLLDLAGLSDFQWDAGTLLQHQWVEEEDEFAWGPASSDIFGGSSSYDSSSSSLGSAFVGGSSNSSGLGSSSSSRWEIFSGSRGADAGDSSCSSSSGGADSSEALRSYVDYCGLQGDGDEDAGKPRQSRVQFMTMHRSKGKEFPCVVTPAFYEGVLPSDRAHTPEELEQERNTAYVGVTRAKDSLLITWPQVAVQQQFYGRSGAPSWDTTMSALLRDVVRGASAGWLPGVQFVEE